MRYLAVIILFSLGAISCSKTEPEPIVLVDIEQTYDVSFFQITTDNGPTFGLSIKTSNPIACAEPILNIDAKITDHVDIHILGYDTSTACNDSIAPQANFILDLDASAYDINFFVEDQISSQVTIEKSLTQFNVSPINIKDIYLQSQSFNIIPDNLAWGYFDIDNSAISEQIIFLEERISELESVLPIFNNLTPGDYGLFTINNLSELELPDIKDLPTTTLFLENFSAINKLETWLLEIQKNYPSIKYFFETWNGHVISNI